MKKILDWNRYIEKAVQTVSEGIVMLINKDNALPLNKKEEVAVFGRIQLHYYKSGTGSGGMVNVSKVTGIVDGLRESGVPVNEELYSVYENGTRRILLIRVKDGELNRGHRRKCLWKMNWLKR